MAGSKAASLGNKRVAVLLGYFSLVNLSSYSDPLGREQVHKVAGCWVLPILSINLIQTAR